MPGHSCAYFMCRNNSERKSMFRFPRNDPNRLKVWLNNCGNKAIAQLPLQKLRSRYLCIDHFNEKYIRNETGHRKRLQKTAIPDPYQTSETVDSSCTPSADSVTLLFCNSHRDRALKLKIHHINVLLKRNRFPVSREVTNTWVNGIRRPTWEPNVQSAVCSVHFKPSCISETKSGLCQLVQGAIPELHLEDTGETSTGYDEKLIQKGQFTNIQGQDTSNVEDTWCDDQDDERIEANDDFDYFARCLANQLRRLPVLHAYDLMQKIKSIVTKKTQQVKEENIKKTSLNPLPSNADDSRKRPASTVSPGSLKEPRLTDLQEKHSAQNEDIVSQQEFLTVTVDAECQEQQKTGQEMTVDHSISYDSNNTVNSATTSVPLVDPLNFDPNDLLVAVIPDEEQYVFKVETEEDTSRFHSILTDSNNPPIRPIISSTPDVLSEHLNTDSIVHPSRQHHGDLDEREPEFLIKIKEEPDDGEYVIIGAHCKKK